MKLAPGEPDYTHQPWPKWFHGPNGQKAVFRSPEDVPAGWAPNADAFKSKTILGADGNAARRETTKIEAEEGALEQTGEDDNEGAAENPEGAEGPEETENNDSGETGEDADASATTSSRRGRPKGSTRDGGS